MPRTTIIHGLPVIHAAIAPASLIWHAATGILIADLSLRGRQLIAAVIEFSRAIDLDLGVTDDRVDQE